MRTWILAPLHAALMAVVVWDAYAADRELTESPDYRPPSPVSPAWPANRGGVRPDIPNLERARYLCPETTNQLFGDPFSGPDARRRQCALTAAAFCFNEAQREQCFKEWEPQALERVIAHFAKQPDRLAPLPATMQALIAVRQKAEASQCDPDIGAANVVRDEAAAMFSAMIDYEFKLELDIDLLGRRNLLGKLSGTFTRDGITTTLAGHDAQRTIVLSYQFDALDDSLKTLLTTFSTSQQHVLDQAVVTVQHVGIPYTYLSDVVAQDTPVIERHSRQKWKRGAGHGKHAKRFGANVDLPASFEYCRHTLRVVSARRVCETEVRSRRDGVGLRALIRGSSGLSGNGWLNYELTVHGVPAGLPTCQRERAACEPWGAVYAIEDRQRIDTASCIETLDRGGGTGAGEQICSCECVPLPSGDLVRMCAIGRDEGHGCVPQRWEKQGWCWETP